MTTDPLDCQVGHRGCMHEARGELQLDPRVAAVNVLDPQTSPRDAWTIEVVVATDDAAPAAIIHALTARGIDIADVSPQGESYVATGVL